MKNEDAKDCVIFTSLGYITNYLDDGRVSMSLNFEKAKHFTKEEAFKIFDRLKKRYTVVDVLQKRVSKKAALKDS